MRAELQYINIEIEKNGGDDGNHDEDDGNKEANAKKKNQKWGEK